MSGQLVEPAGVDEPDERAQWLARLIAGAPALDADRVTELSAIFRACQRGDGGNGRADAP